MGKFVHHHLHSEFSALDSIIKIEDIPKRAKELGMSSIGISDHGGLGGVYKFFNACKEEGIQPIIGMEAYWTQNDITLKGEDELGNKSYHMLLIALDNEGLHNLFKLSSIAFTDGHYIKPPRINDKLLEQYNGGLCATTACLGSRYNQLILNGRRADALKLLQYHKELFSGRFLIELETHEMEEQLIVNQVLMELAKEEDIPTILTQDSHYELPEDKPIHELALCMQTQKTINDYGRLTFGDLEVHIGDHDYMWEKAQKQNIPYEAISNTVALAKMVKSDTYFNDIMNRYPTFQNLPTDMPSWKYLESQAKEGLWDRFGELPPEEYRDRLAEELKVIKKMGFSDYMLIVQQLLDDARTVNLPLGPGRGSSAGSLVAYALQITEVDPLKFSLLLSRFLNEGRSAKPLIFTEGMKKEHERINNC